MQKAAQAGEPAVDDIGALLGAWSELQSLARRYMKGERPGHSLRPVDLERMSTPRAWICRELTGGTDNGL